MVAIQITALHDPVAVVHIPIALAPMYESKLYWTIVEAAEFSEEFFNVTSNTLEIAIFASTELINREWAIDRQADLRISSSWRVFEMSSGDEEDEVNYDSPHLRQVSAPLAKAGITILYQSSYFTDFLLVKESDFDRASTIFSEHGWHVDPVPAPPSSSRRHSLLSPLTPVSVPTTPHSSTGIRPSPPPPSLPQISVLRSPLACVGFLKTLEPKTEERIHRFVTWPERVQASIIPSPSPSAISLPLSEDGMRGRRSRPRPFLSYTRTEEGSSLVTEVSILRGLFQGEESLQAGAELLADFDAGFTGEEGPDKEFEDEDGDESDDDQGDGDEAEVHAEFDEEAEGYVFESVSRGSSSSVTVTPLGRHIYTPSPDDSTVAQSYSLHPTPGAGGEDLQISWSSRTRAGTKMARDSSGGGKRRSASPSKKARTSYDRDGSPTSHRPDTADKVGQSEGEGDGDEGKRRGHKACLQLDCRSLDLPQNGESHHLDSCGLLTRFSTLLESGGIKMLYSSTFHTANILVEARDVKLAKGLLEKRRSFS